MTAFLGPFTSSLIAVVVAAVVARLAVRGARAQRRAEFGWQLLELLQLATRRGAALGPVLHRAAADGGRRERRWLGAIARKLDSGAPLSDALASIRPACFTPQALAAVASSEGTAQLPGMLGDLAARHGVEEQERFRWLLWVGYPAFLAFVFVVVSMSWTRIHGAAHLSTPSMFALAIVGAWLVFVTTGGASRLGRWLRGQAERLPWIGPSLRLRALGRALQAAGGVCQGGFGLDRALESAAATAGDSLCASDLRAAASIARSGATPREVWERAKFPSFVLARVAADSGGGSKAFAQRLREAGAECDRRAIRALGRSRRIVHLAALLAIAALLGLQFHGVFAWLAENRAAASETLPW